MSDRRHVRPATVLEAWSVTAAMRRLVLGGPGLSDFVVPPGALGPYLKLHLPGGRGGRDVVRTYSVRRHDPERGRLDVDMLLHGSGVGARFAAEARPGDGVQVGGPGFIPADPCADYILAGDHTALPAIAHILDTLPRGPRVQAYIEVPNPGEEQPLASVADLTVTWLHRKNGAASRLAEAVRTGWPGRPGDLLLWAGAEAAISRAIRFDARRLHGIPVARCQVLNYWKIGQPEGGFSYVA